MPAVPLTGAESVPSENPVTAVIATPRHLLTAGLLLVTIIAAVLWLFTQRGSAPKSDLSSQPGGWWGVLLFIALSAIVHEGLHVLGWCVAGGARWKALSFILTRRGLGLAARVHTPVSMRRYRVATV